MTTGNILILWHLGNVSEYIGHFYNNRRKTLRFAIPSIWGRTKRGHTYSNREGRGTRRKDGVFNWRYTARQTHDRREETIKVSD